MCQTVPVLYVLTYRRLFVVMSNHEDELGKAIPNLSSCLRGDSFFLFFQLFSVVYQLISMLSYHAKCFIDLYSATCALNTTLSNPKVSLYMHILYLHYFFLGCTLM